MSPDAGEADIETARQTAEDLSKRVRAGEDFAALANEFSQDQGSAASGGDLGWVSPGDTVAEFEQTFKQSALNAISEPFYTQYGVHVLEVLDRRTKNITDQMVRMRAENILRRQRAEREFQQWVRQLKEEAYIEHIAVPTA